jgi:hypothetical protein
LGHKGFVHLKEPLYIAPLNEGSLTSKNPVFMDLQEPSNQMSFLSLDRQKYTSLYKSFHDKKRLSPQDLRLPFPPRYRSFPKPLAIRSSELGIGNLVIGSIATYPKRAKSFQRVVSQILGQVDLLRVHLNNYDEIPSFLQHDKIRVTTSKDYGDLRDNGKFLRGNDLPLGYHLTFDDDLNYPPYYVSYLVAKCMQYNNKAVVGLHGTTINPAFSRYHDKSSRTTDTYRLPLPRDKFVSIFGTGTICYYTGTVQFGLDGVTSTGMIDLWFAAHCREVGVPMLCVSRGSGWLADLDNLEGESLYSEFINRDEMQTEFVLKTGLNGRAIHLPEILGNQV